MPFVPATPPPRMPDGNTILQRAASAWHVQRLPPYVEFTTFSDQISNDPVRVIIRTRDGKAYVETIPSGHNAKAVEYPGVTLEGPGHSQLGFCVSDLHCTGVLGADPFGSASTGPLRTIAAVHTFWLPYTVTATQYLDFDGTPVYDLKLQLKPNLDPSRFRMRELVVDATTYRVWKMIYEEPQNSKRLLVYGFGPVEDMWYLRQTCDAVPITFSDMAVPACTPDVAMMWDYTFPSSVPDSDFVSSDGTPRTLVIVSNDS